jgi:hypothetical protein
VANFATKSNGPVRLSYKPYFFSEGIIFSLTTNQQTVFFNLSFQQSEPDNQSGSQTLPNLAPNQTLAAETATPELATWTRKE